MKTRSETSWAKYLREKKRADSLLESNVALMYDNARLRRIEEAAKKVVVHVENFPTSPLQDDGCFDALRQSLTDGQEI